MKKVGEVIGIGICFCVIATPVCFVGSAIATGAYQDLIAEEMSLEELEKRIEVKRTFDGEHIFTLPIPSCQKGTHAREVLYRHVETWLEENNREVLSVDYSRSRPWSPGMRLITRQRT